MASADHRPTDRTLVLLSIVVLAPLLVMSFAMPTMGMMGWWAHDSGPVGVLPWWGLGVSLLWLVVIVAVGYLGYQGLTAREGSETDRDAALEALRLAHARGDLMDEEFESRRAVSTVDRSRGPTIRRPLRNP